MTTTLSLNGAEKALSLYIEGHGDPKKLVQAFDSNAIIRGNYKDTDRSWTAPEFIKRAGNTQARISDITWLARNSDTAVARVLVHLGSQCYQDYLTIQRFEDDWRIVFKAFSADCRVDSLP